MSYFSEEIEIGIGELIFYCFIPTHAEAYYGKELLVLTLFRTGLSVILNLWFIEKRGLSRAFPLQYCWGYHP